MSITPKKAVYPLKILLGVTGSVATLLCFKLRKYLQSRGHDVKLVATDRAVQFMKPTDNCPGEWVYMDSDEFYNPSEYYRTGPIKHIDLRDWADLFLIAPCSANTLAKLSNGLCDNLLTSIARAWDWNKPFYIAPAMNTNMWTHPVTKVHLDVIKSFGAKVIWPTSNVLACGQSGIGAMAHITTIANLIEGHRWSLPIRPYGHKAFIPEFPHQGAFGVTRTHYNHTGVDIYTTPSTNSVSAVEDGIIVAVEPFTGEIAGSPWWNDTYHVTVQGKSGCVVYGEITPSSCTKLGNTILCGYYIGEVKQVLKNKPKNPPENHSLTMLHIELLTLDSPNMTAAEWPIGEQKSKFVLDPTPYLLLGDD